MQLLALELNAILVIRAQPITNKGIAMSVIASNFFKTQ
jgi:hypothetical protein